MPQCTPPQHNNKGGEKDKIEQIPLSDSHHEQQKASKPGKSWIPEVSKLYFPKNF
jgi:hypothetical protein